MTALAQLPLLATQAPVRPLNFGNITYQKSDGTAVTRGIQVILLDQTGQPMDLPHGWTLDPQLIADCQKIANDLIREMLTQSPQLKDNTLGGFDAAGLMVVNDPRVPGVIHPYLSRAPQMWQVFNRTIHDYFNPVPGVRRAGGRRLDLHPQQITDPQFAFRAY